MKRKIVALIAASTAAIGIAACSGSSNEAKEAARTAVREVSPNIANNSDAEIDEFLATICGESKPLAEDGTPAEAFAALLGQDGEMNALQWQVIIQAAAVGYCPELVEWSNG